MTINSITEQESAKLTKLFNEKHCLITDFSCASLRKLTATKDLLYFFHTMLKQNN